MAMDLKEIEKYIKEAMPDALIEIQDLAGDGNHYSATITSSKFVGKSKIVKVTLEKDKIVFDKKNEELISEINKQLKDCNHNVKEYLNMKTDELRKKIIMTVTRLRVQWSGGKTKLPKDMNHSNQMVD